MRVKDIITQLTAMYDGEDDLIIAYWDRETVSSFAGLGEPMKDEQWGEVVNTYENGEWAWQSMAADTLADIHDEVVYI